MIEEILKIVGEYAEEWGYLVVFLVMFLENSIFLGAFVPGETMALLSGFYAAQGILNPVYLVIIISVGAILGDSVGFYFGRWKGTKWLVKIGKYFGYREEKIDRAQDFWKEHGKSAIFIGRYITVARTFVPFLAGASKKIRYKDFLPYDMVGAISWAAVHVALGYFFGAYWETIKTVFGGIGTVLFIGLFVLGYRYFVRKGIVRDKE